MRPHKGDGKLIVIEGIDGSGKNTVINGLVELVIGNFENQEVFNVTQYEIEHKIRPRLKDENVRGENFPRTEGFLEAHTIISGEPCEAGTGYDIRHEVIKDNGRHYSPLTTAQMYSSDREVNNKKIVLPCLEEGKFIFQSRNMTSSLVYQPVQWKASLDNEDNEFAYSSFPITEDSLTSVQFPGNYHELNHCAPDLLIIQTISVEETSRRLGNRGEKVDGTIFDGEDFQTKIAKRYQSEWLREMWENQGTQVAYVDSEQPPYEVINDCYEYVKELI